MVTLARADPNSERIRKHVIRTPPDQRQSWLQILIH